MCGQRATPRIKKNMLVVCAAASSTNRREVMTERCADISGGSGGEKRRGSNDSAAEKLSAPQLAAFRRERRERKPSVYPLRQVAKKQIDSVALRRGAWGARQKRRECSERWGEQGPKERAVWRRRRRGDAEHVRSSKERGARR